MSFAIGDHVEWTSQASGSQRTKRGFVLCVVPIRTFAATVLGKLVILEDYNMRNLDGGYHCREHESYIIRETQPVTSQAKPKLYWPRVAYLRKVDTDENAP